MRKRNIEVKFRLTEDEHTELMQKVRESGMNRNAFLVRMVQQQTIFPVGKMEEIRLLVANLLTQVRGMANNMNQITKMAHTRKEVPCLEYLDYCRTAIQNFKEEIHPVFTELRKVLHGDC